MDHQTGGQRPRKRRRIESSEDVPDLPETNTRVSNKEMATQQITTAATPAQTSLFEDFRSIITCKICFRLLYEPFTLACGHTHCYSCLCEWFGRTEDRRKTCPDCRAAVKQAPAPAYIVRELTQKYITHPECLPEGETTQQHEKARTEESAMVEAERGVLGGAGLFRGLFNKPERERLPAMIDGEDGVSRCPYCAWELEPGHGTTCPHCHERHDGSGSDEYDSEEDDMDEIEYPHGWPPRDEDLDEEIDDDDMDDEDALQMLDRDPFGPPPGAGFETGGETYFVSSGDDDVASVQEVGRHRRRFTHRDDQGVIEMMRADGEARRDALSRQLVAHEQDLINGGHIPHRRRSLRGSTSPGHPSDVDSDEEEDYDSDDDAGSLNDFVVREDEESTLQQDPEFSSMYNTDEDDVISVTIQPGGSDDSDGHSSSSEDVSRRDRARHRHQQEVASRNRHISRGGGRGRGRGAPIMVSDPSSSSEGDDSDGATPPQPRGPRRRTAGRAPAARTEEESAEEAIQRVLDETDHNSSEEASAEEAIRRVLEETEGAEASSSDEEEEEDEDDLPVRRTRQRR